MPQNVPDSKQGRKEAANRLLLRRKARSNLLDFTRFTFPEFRESWHHRLVASKLDQFVNGEITNLAITMPPRHTKSELVSRRLPAFIFGVNPNAKIISCSYGADLAAMMNRDVQKILTSPEYRELFPNTTLNESNVRTDSHGSYLRNSEIFEIVGYKGIYKCAGVGGSITGFGFDYGLIDDPIRNRADAESPTYRQNIKDWYNSVFRTRRQKGAGILITLTRWQEDDLLGWLLDLAEKNPNVDQFEVISLPALSEETLAPYDERTEPNKALWEDEFSTEDMFRTKETLTVYEWLSLYQQRPSAAAGNLVKKEQFKYCSLVGDVLDLGGTKQYLLSQCRIFQTCDPAASTKTSADYFVLGTWVQTPDNDLALIDLIHTRLETPDQVPLFRQQFNRWKPGTQWVGTKGLGISLYQLLKNEGLPVDKIEEDVDKVSRFIPAATRIAAGTVFFLDTLDGLHDYETELLGFPNAAHDDMCFIAGTLISTDHGQIPIENLKTSYKVLTRGGYKEIEMHGVTSECSDVITITFENGKQLSGTRHHPVFVTGKGFIPLDTITCGDHVLSEFKTSMRLNSTELFSEDTQTQTVKHIKGIIPRIVFVEITALVLYIKKFGSFIMGKFQKDAQSIIRMGTLSITRLKISNVCHSQNIAKNTITKVGETKNYRKDLSNILKKCDRLLKNGTGRKKVENGMRKMLKGAIKTGNQLKEYAKNVVKISMTYQDLKPRDFVQAYVPTGGDGKLELITRNEHASFVEQSSQPTSTKEQFVALEVVRLDMGGRKEKVYNLSVKDTHEYFANGVLVHNCDITSMAVKVVIDNPFRNETIDLTKMFRTRSR